MTELSGCRISGTVLNALRKAGRITSQQYLSARGQIEANNLQAVDNFLAQFGTWEMTGDICDCCGSTVDRFVITNSG